MVNRQQYDYNVVPDLEYFRMLKRMEANRFDGGGEASFGQKVLNYANENSNMMAGISAGLNNTIQTLQDPNASNAQKVFGALGIGAASKIWEGDTSKVDNAIKDAQAQMQIGKNNLIQDASSVSGTMNGLKANSIMPRQRINFTPTYYNDWKELKGGKGGFWKNMGTATLQGAANGSIGGPWGAAGGAIAGILGSVAGLFGRKNRYKKAMAKANERMNYMVNAARGFNMEQDFAEKAANQNLITNGINTQRVLDMANFSAYGGSIDLSPNLMALQQQKQDNDHLKALNQPFSLGLGNSFNQKMNMFPDGGNVDEDDGDNDFQSENTTGETISNLLTLGSNYFSNRIFADDYLTQQGDTLRYGNGLFTIDGTTDVSNRVFGVRNRGDYSPITSEGAPITSINKFVPYNAKYNTEANKHKTYLGIDKNGKIKVGGIDKFEEGDMITLTTSNYIKDFKQDNNGNTVYKQATKRQDSRRKTPITIVKGDNGDIEGSLAVLTGKTGNIDEDKYMFGQAAGGRVLVTDDNGHYSVLAGSTESIIKQFRDFKKKYNLDYVNTINLDNGTFSNGLYTESGQMSKDALRDYDNLNTGGGNFMYFKDTTPKSPYGWRQYGSGYINDSGDTFGVNSVMSTTLPTEGMLITDVHKPNPNYKRSEPSYSYKSKDGETYFIQKGSEDGHFKVFDSYGLHIKPQNVPNDVRSAVLDYARSLGNNVVSPETEGIIYDPYAEDKPVYSEEDLTNPYIESSQNNDFNAQAHNDYLDYYRKQEDAAKRRQEEGHVTEDWYLPLLNQPNKTIDSVGTNFADSSIANILNVPDSAIFAKPKTQQDTVPPMVVSPINETPKEHIITDPRELDEIFTSTGYYDPASAAFWEQYRKTPESPKEPKKEEKKTEKSEDKGNKTKNSKAYTPSQRYRGYGEVKALLGNEEDVKAFQRRAGIKVDGIVGNQTVIALQKMLNEHGYNLKEDGIYGEKSSAAYNDYMSKLYQQDKYDQMQYAYGGTIDSTDYALAVTKEALDAERAKAKQNTQTVINMLYGDRHGEADNGNRYDFGGTMKNLPSEMQSYETGGTHEQNPYGGIQIGTDQQGNPNLVEQGEFRYGDYIFSDRIPVNYDTLFDFGLIASVPKKKPKKGQEKTYADYAKDLVNKTGDPNDPITKRTNDANLQRLANAEEYQKAAEQGQLALDDSLNEYKSALKNGQSPMYGSMKYNGMNGGANPMDASSLTNVSRSGTPMMAAYGGNLFAAGGSPDDPFAVNRYNIAKDYPQNVLADLIPAPRLLPDYSDPNYIDPYARDYDGTVADANWLKRAQGFSQYNDLTTGYFDPDEIAALRGSYGLSRSGGADKDFIMALQTDLKNKGYYKGKIDGDFGPKSAAALDAMNGTWTWTPYNDKATTPTNTQFNGALSKYNSSYTSKSNGRFAGNDAAQTAVEGMTNIHTTDPNSPQAPVENTGTVPPQTGQMADTTRWQFNKLPTQGKWATLGLNAVQAGADANGFTNPDFTPNFNDANRLERKGEASTFARTNAHIGGYQAPDITDIQSPLAQAAQQQQATNRALQNMGGNRASRMASIVANDYNAGQTMGDIVTKANAQNAANRMAAAEINRGIDQFNAQSDNDMYKDNLNAQIQGQQMNLSATQAANDNRLRQTLYQDATNRQAHQNIVTNQNQMYNNALNMIADQAARNEEWNLINSKHNQDFYFDPKTGGWEYKGDSGAYSKLNNALATIYPDMPMTGLSADVQKEWNNLLQSKGGQNITDDEIRWIVDMERNAQIEQKAKREHELKLAELNRANTAKANGGYISNKKRNKYTNFDYNAI